ncbi:MAG: hypothetical protein WCW33_03560 [Candidatus Babeliales bacterium]
MKIRSLAIATAVIACSVFAMRAQQRPSEADLAVSASAAVPSRPVTAPMVQPSGPGYPAPMAQPYGATYPASMSSPYVATSPYAATTMRTGMPMGQMTTGQAAAMLTAGTVADLSKQWSDAGAKAVLSNTETSNKATLSNTETTNQIRLLQEKSRLEKEALEAKISSEKAARESVSAEKIAEMRQKQEIEQAGFDKIMKSVKNASDAANKALGEARIEINGLNEKIVTAASLGIDTTNETTALIEARASLKAASDAMTKADALLASALDELQLGKIPLINGAYNQAKGLADAIVLSSHTATLVTSINKINAETARATQAARAKGPKRKQSIAPVMPPKKIKPAPVEDESVDA